MRRLTSTLVLTVNATGTNSRRRSTCTSRPRINCWGQGGTPSSVNVVSDLGGKTGQGVTVIP